MIPIFSVCWYTRPTCKSFQNILQALLETYIIIVGSSMDTICSPKCEKSNPPAQITRSERVTKLIEIEVHVLCYNSTKVRSNFNTSRNKNGCTHQAIITVKIKYSCTVYYLYCLHILYLIGISCLCFS